MRLQREPDEVLGSEKLQTLGCDGGFGAARTELTVARQGVQASLYSAVWTAAGVAWGGSWTREGRDGR
jgi:hypothetical protein